MIALVDFDAFLETAGPGRDDRARALAVSSARSAELRSKFSGIIALWAARDAVISSLGPPHALTTDAVIYNLPSKPKHSFEFRFDDLGRLLVAKYVRDTVRGAALPTPRSLRDDLEMLRDLGVTDDEVVARYGAPEEIEGWWPIDTWTYGSQAFDVRLGIVI